eukprot:3622407-Lingulodinium_polyedra.AAC.1
MAPWHDPIAGSRRAMLRDRGAVPSLRGFSCVLPSGVGPRRTCCRSCHSLCATRSADGAWQGGGGDTLRGQG